MKKQKIQFRYIYYRLGKMLVREEKKEEALI